MRQCACYCESPRVEHGQAVKWLGQYLSLTKDKGIDLTLNNDALHLYVDADYSGNWREKDAQDDENMVKRRHGFITTLYTIPFFCISTNT